MPSVVHVVATAAFAGVERYVADVALESTARGWDVSVIGGNRERMRQALREQVAWLPGETATEALRSLARFRHAQLYHAHMTVAEIASLAARPLHRAPVVATRHFARRRGTHTIGKVISPLIARGLSAEIAISNFVAQAMERAPAAVILNGVPEPPLLWNPQSRIVLVLQRLEAEKDTLTALRGWRASGLFSDGWTMRVVGNGRERSELEEWTNHRHVAGVEFADWTADVWAEFARAGILVAPAPAEPFGLTVVEAMAAGIPVIASAAGGHLETIGRLKDTAMFYPRDADALGALLRIASTQEARVRASHAGRELALSELSNAEHVRQLLELYQTVLSSREASRR
ncbi:MAG: glycosyltransferase family 4 protein [Actinobacteria bacterium]|nr:glycosyltransferase family 4 protein [Actinomycetota bacterium]